MIHKDSPPGSPEMEEGLDEDDLIYIGDVDEVLEVLDGEDNNEEDNNEDDEGMENEQPEMGHSLCVFNKHEGDWLVELLMVALFPQIFFFYLFIYAARPFTQIIRRKIRRDQVRVKFKCYYHFAQFVRDSLTREFGNISMFKITCLYKVLGFETLQCRLIE